MKTTTTSQGSTVWVRALALGGAFAMGAVSGAPSARADVRPVPPQVVTGKSFAIEQPVSAINGPKVRWSGTLGHIEVSQSSLDGSPYPSALFVSSDGAHKCTVQTQTWEEAHQFASQVQASSVTGLVCSHGIPGNNTSVLEGWPRAACTTCFVKLEMSP
jgi:hypothetical protein